jgi:pimeloyl-ACP methyl ester carboxylesterase
MVGGMEIVSGEQSLNVQAEGAVDGPPVLLLHGITSSIHTWDWLMPHLVDRYRVVRLDFRGHGESSRTSQDYNLAQYLADALAACQSIGEPCMVVGHSLGGITAAALAQAHPDLVRAVILEDPPLGLNGDLEGNALLDAFKLMRVSIPQLQATAIPVDVLAGVLGAAPSASGPAFSDLLHPDGLTSMAVGMLHVDASVLDPVLEGTMQPVFVPTEPIVVPTLLITADPASPDAAARPPFVQQLASTSPNVEVRVMAGAGHMIHDELTQREAFLALLLEFLQRHS